MGEPARPYSWPPFEPGNDAATKHGAHSDRRWRPLADRLAADLIDRCPWLSSPSYAAEVAGWARAEAQLRLVAEYLDRMGMLDDAGEPRSATNLQARLETTAARRRESLGMSPLAHGRLLATFAAAARTSPEAITDGLEHLAAAGRVFVDAHLASALPADSPALPALLPAQPLDGAEAPLSTEPPTGEETGR